MLLATINSGTLIIALPDLERALGTSILQLVWVILAYMIASTVLVLTAGRLSDMFGRKRAYVGGFVLFGIASLGAGFATGGTVLILWRIVQGVGGAFLFANAGAVVTDAFPREQLGLAMGTNTMVAAVGLVIGPVLGGVLVGALGAGYAFALDAASFAVSALALMFMRTRPRARSEAGGSIGGEIRAGFAYIRRHVWLWATFATAAVAYLLFMGPAEVLLPYVVKNELGGSAADLGLVFAAGGLGSLGCAVVMGQRGLPRRDITFMYLVWTAATLAVAGYGLADAVWQLMLASLAFNALETAGTIVWATAKQRHVPPALLGRVSSLDWLISIGLLPLSFALTGPVSAAIGAQATLIGAGLIGGAITFAALLLPGMRAIEGREAPASA
jgi:MFS family permease